MTLTDTSKSLLRIAAATFLLVAAFWICPRCKQERPTGSESTIKTDTLYIRDTILIREPVLRSVCQIDTILVTVHQLDTMMLHDTLYIQLPREQRLYSNENYSAWVSGFHPQLDSIRIYPQTQLITSTITHPKSRPKRWGIGIQAGYGATINGNIVQTSPYIGVGVSYNIITF